MAEIFPKGVVNVITGRGASVSQTLVEHPKVAMVSLTGDVSTGRKILQAATGTLKRTHLELGGKAPVLVFDDADIGAVVEGLRTFGYYNAGQDCTAACRVYAGSKVYDKLVAGARQEDEIVKREVFGPVVSITRFSDTEQAIAWANDSDYGLASSVWTQDEPPRFLRRLQPLRRRSHGQVKLVFTRSARACRSPGAGASRRIPIVVGSRGVHRAEDRLRAFGGAGRGQASRS